jgi:CubicO group peptidase (beta-lactamase class C family)
MHPTRRQILGWGAAAAALPSFSSVTSSSSLEGYDRYVAGLRGFSGVVLVSHRGRTRLSRSSGLASPGVPIHENTAFALSSAGKPFNAISILQLAQRGKLDLNDPVGKHLTGFDPELAGKVTIHHMISGASGMNTPAEAIDRIFHSRDEVHAYQESWARQARLVATPGLPGTFHYVEENIFRRAGMAGSGFYTRPQWLTDPRIAHPYMAMDDGSRLDALQHLETGSPQQHILGRNPGRAFIDAIGDGGFSTAPDLVRFARALYDGTLLDRPWAEVLTAPKLPVGGGNFGTYGPPASIVGGQWVIQRAGGNAGICANWTIYPDTGWVGVILANHDNVPLLELIERETRAVTASA